jgi:hypothetical protein
MNKRKPRVLVLAAKWWPLSARLASAVSGHGCRVAAICPVGHPLTHVSTLDRVYRYAGIDSLASVRHALHDWQPDVIVPCDDGVVAQMHALHRLDPALRPLIERSLGSPDGFPIIQSRHRLLALAESLGVRVPRTRRVKNADDLESWHRDVGSHAVLKVDGESGGNGVFICRSLDESLAAWRKLNVRRGYLTAWKRLIIDRNPLTLWEHRVARDPEVSVQEFVTGRPANCMMVCREGEVLSMISVAVVAAEGPVGAAVIVRIIRDEHMTRAAKLLAERLQLSGFFGLDFLIDATGVPLLIEMNPRCTQLGHFELTDHASLAAVFSASLRGEPIPAPKHPIRRSTIALFPQALAAGEVCRPLMAVAHHDVPVKDERLYCELKLPSWPRRQWPSVLYHWFVRVHRSDPVLFEAAPLIGKTCEGAGEENSAIGNNTAPIRTS